jgi:hypothetical protein
MMHLAAEIRQQGLHFSLNKQMTALLGIGKMVLMISKPYAYSLPCIQLVVLGTQLRKRVRALL